MAILGCQLDYKGTGHTVSDFFWGGGGGLGLEWGGSTSRPLRW